MNVFATHFIGVTLYVRVYSQCAKSCREEQYPLLGNGYFPNAALESRWEGATGLVGGFTRDD